MLFHHKDTKNTKKKTKEESHLCLFFAFVFVPFVSLW
jgi:hypothetical protein